MCYVFIYIIETILHIYIVLIFLFLCKLHAQRGAWTTEPEIQTHMLQWLSRLGTPHKSLFQIHFYNITWIKTINIYIQDANAVASEIALLFKAPLSRGGFRYVCLYKGILTKDESNYKTKEDSVEGQTIKLSGVFAPLISNGIPSIEVDDNDEQLTEKQKTMIKAWFTKVPEYSATGLRAVEKKK